MNRALITVIGLILVLTASQAHSQQRRQLPEAPEPDSLAGKYYAGVTGSVFEYRDINSNNPTTNAVGLLFGKYMNDFIKFEVRSGAGFGSERAVPGEDLDVEVDYYFSGYVGLYYQWSTFSQFYGQAGVSHVSASASGSLAEEEAGGGDLGEIDDDLFTNNVSPSFLLGVAVDVPLDAEVFIEAGRLHTDPNARTNIDLWQYSTGLRYAF